MVSKMGLAISAINGVQYWRHGLDGLLAASNVTAVQGQDWGWLASLEAAGLQQIQAPLQ
jgi:hypothetical protein